MSTQQTVANSNRSHIVDISHDKELSKGVTTSGQKSDYDEKNKTVTQKIAEKTEEMADKVNTSSQRIVDKIDQTAVGASSMGSKKLGGTRNVQPGTEHLKGTNDNFNDDPAISLGEMKDKLRETKESVKEGAKAVTPQAVIDGPGQMLEHAAKNVKEAIKATPLHDIGHSVKVKVKEMVTGEREKEKPDEAKSEVRTKGWEQRKQQQGGGR